MQNVYIIGAGGHGREVAEILRHAAANGAEATPAGFVDDDARLHGERIDELPVVGGWSWLEAQPADEIAVICAVGTPRVCRMLAERAEALGLRFASAVSPLALVSPLARLGRGVTIFPQTVVNTGAEIGDFSILNVGVTASHDVRVGRWVNVNPGVRLAGSVTVEDGCYVGMGTNVIQGQTIGAWSTIGAGTVVIRNVPPQVTAVGVPARVVKRHEMPTP